MNQFFKEIFAYGHHYNQELGSAIIEHADQISEKAVGLYCHILNAHQIWNERLEQRQPTVVVWQRHPLSVCLEMDKQNYANSLAILKEADLNETIRYTTFQGTAFNNRIRDIFFHIVNHSTYHRGQIATEFRVNGIPPLVTDYVFYKR